MNHYCSQSFRSTSKDDYEIEEKIYLKKQKNKKEAKYDRRRYAEV